ncbi:MAG TPA: TRIC cation channel family protein, partial [Chitinophagaceae bacterium]|nr:TRIC cation channel family protein [Chitinophagaceae bacterium]
GLFTMIGIQKGLSHELGAGICVMLGTVTGCFGGVLRDVLLNKIPLIFHKEVYASASIVGGVLFFILIEMELAVNFAYIISILAVFIVRFLAVQYNWSLPNWYAGKNQTPS